MAATADPMKKTVPVLVLLLSLAMPAAAHAAFPGRNGSLTFTSWSKVFAERLSVHLHDPHGRHRDAKALRTQQARLLLA